MEDWKLISINVNGLNDNNKRRIFLTKLVKENADIVCLQEVHIKKENLNYLNYEKLGKLHAALADKKKRGVAVYIKKEIKTELKYTDPKGRVLMIELKRGNYSMLLIVIYAPNKKLGEFYRKLREKISTMESNNICIIGDFNGIIDPDKDSKGTKKGKKKRGSLPKSFFDMMEECNLVDLWRVLHPDKKQYTYFSHPNKSWSRIDLMLISRNIGLEIDTVEITPNVWADHNPLEVAWKSTQRRKNRRWRLNNKLLKDKQCMESIKKDLRQFFEENEKGIISKGVIWDTMKAFLRGLLISYGAFKNKKRREKQKTIIEDLRKWEAELQQQPDDRKIKENWALARHKLNIIDQEELAYKMKRTKQYYFENANKPGRWLSYRLKKEREKGIIHQLEDSKGHVTNREETKAEIVREYYTELYAEERITKEKIEQYLLKGNLPKIGDEEKEILNKEITMLELKLAISKLKKNKSPGPDGFPGELYINEDLAEIILPKLLGICNEALIKAQIPETWREAYVTLIPKEGEDLKLIKNYRPISLLNTDYKLYMSILADRLKTILNKLIHSDQSGFLPGRQIRNNTRTILDVLEYYEEHSNTEVALIFVDAQKAFDNLNWQFIKQQIAQMEFGENFVKSISTIYEKQKANILLNGELTQTFPIRKGVRQGCPLSPLLFILALEVLLQKIRRNNEIKGLTIRKETYKLQAFADDVVIITEDPVESGTVLLEELEEYGEVAGFKLNKSKTKLLVKNMREIRKKELERTMGIEITKKVKYLGVWISARFSSLKEDNYTPLIKSIKKDLEKWDKLRISLMGRIATIKMNTLPKLLYLFQTAPIKLERKFFTDLNCSIRKFIWGGKKPRIALKYLQDKKERGGLGLPNWEIYQKAANLMWLKDWVMLRNKRLLVLEGYNLQKGWHALLWDMEKPKTLYHKHKIRETLLGTWNDIKRKQYIKIPRWVSPMEATIYPNLLEIGKMMKYSELLDGGGGLKSQEQLAAQGIYIDWWPYAQIKSRYRKDKEQFGFEISVNGFDKIWLGSDDKLLAKLYKFLRDYEMVEEEVKEPMLAWAKNMGQTINLNEWETIWRYNIKMTRAITFKENHYKMFYRWHMAPARLAKIYPNIKPNCWKCHFQQGTFFHCWWTCKQSQKFWKLIGRWIGEIIKEKFEFGPKVFLLGILKPGHEKRKRFLIIHIITAARISFAQHWKDTHIPSEDDIIRKILESAEMNKLTFELNDRDDSEYYDVWEMWYEWLRGRNKKQ